MEELKLLIDMVANLPTLAVWVLVGYLAYKVVVVGSIYGVIRLAIVKFHDYLVRPREYKLAGIAINDNVAAELGVQLARLRGSYNNVHSFDVGKLRKAIDLIEKGEIK